MLEAAGEQRSDWLLRLSPRQCLVLALDTSQSMAPAVAALRQRTARLAQLEPQLRPGCFVLVPFSGAGQLREGGGGSVVESLAGEVVYICMEGSCGLDRWGWCVRLVPYAFWVFVSA